MFKFWELQKATTNNNRELPDGTDIKIVILESITLGNNALGSPIRKLTVSSALLDLVENYSERVREEGMGRNLKHFPKVTVLFLSNITTLHMSSVWGNRRQTSWNHNPSPVW